MALILHPGSAAPLLAQGAAGAEPQSWWDVLRHDVIPVAAAYLVFLGMLIRYRRATQRPNDARGHAAGGERGRRVKPATGAAPGWGDLLRYLGRMAAGGYLFFLAIVLVFYFILGGEDLEFIRQALVEGSLLAFALVLPAFLVFTAIDELRLRRGSAKH